MEGCRQGARFAKWRAALSIGERLPSNTAVDINARELAEYAAVCQARDLVPIVEPEVTPAFSPLDSINSSRHAL